MYLMAHHCPSFHKFKHQINTGLAANLYPPHSPVFFCVPHSAAVERALLMALDALVIVSANTWA